MVCLHITMSPEPQLKGTLLIVYLLCLSHIHIHTYISDWGVLLLLATSIEKTFSYIHKQRKHEIHMYNIHNTSVGVYVYYNTCM